MKLSCVFLIVFTLLITLTTLPCPGTEKAETKEDANSIWTEDEPRGYRSRRWELTDEEIERLLKTLEAKKAKELTKLRETEPEKFRNELRNQARDEFEKVIRERIEQWRKARRAEFLEWLEKNSRREARELTKLKGKDPELYNKKFDLVWRKYRRIYEAWRRNPDLGKVLLEDLGLKKRVEELVGAIKNTKDDKKKNELRAKLKGVVSARFDLIVRRQQIAYKQLLKRLEELQKQINENRDQMIKSRDKKVKEREVEARIIDLLDPNFKWD